MADAAAPPRHLVTVWNPSYASNAMEEHLAVLLELARRLDADQVDEDEVYVWWGKVRSPNRQQRQAHMDEIRALARAIEDEPERETHLYLTDYRALYVGLMAGIVEGELPERERAHAPAYYGREGLSCDFWFRLEDIRRLVPPDDLPAVIEELRALRNVHYADRPVSLYGGMVDLPLIVTRPDGRRYFDPDETELATGGRLWAEFDAEEGSAALAMQRELRDDLLGARAWAGLEPAARTFIATGEKIFREHRGDPAFDFAPVLGSFSKALEVQVNATLRRAMPRLKPDERRANVGGRTEDLAAFRPLMLVELARAIGGEPALNAGLGRVLEQGGWFAGQLPAILDGFAAVRNPGTHSARIDQRTAATWRDRLLGVGCEGVFVQLGRVAVR